MRLINVVVVIAAALPTLGLGCPDKPTSTCEAIMRAQCEIAFRCCDAEERLDGLAPGISGAYINNEAECIERSVGTCRYLSASNDDAVTLGRMTFDAEAATACLAALNGARDQCDLSLVALAQRGPGQVCGRALGVGAVEPGEACARSTECRLGGACVFDAEPTVDEELGAVEGQCSDVGEDGDDCGARPCGTGLYCAEGSCAPLPGQGDPCVGGALCANGHFCDGTSCEPFRAAGEDCTQGFQCLSAECDDGDCAGAGVCDGA